MTHSSDPNTDKLNEAYLSTRDFSYERLFSKASLPKHRYIESHSKHYTHYKDIRNTNLR